MSDTKLKLEKVNITLDSKIVLDNVNLKIIDGDIRDSEKLYESAKEHDFFVNQIYS